jgi:hypothetical protein
MGFFKKNAEVEKKKGEVATTADNFASLFNESEAHKEIICNAIRDLISANSNIDTEIETIDVMMQSLADIKVEYLALKDHNKELLKKLMPIMKDEI